MTFIAGQRPVAPWRFHHWWGQWNTAAQLPNTAAFTDGGYTSEIQAGDLAWVVDVASLYVCTDPTPGAAVWVAIAAVGAVPSLLKFSGQFQGDNVLQVLVVITDSLSENASDSIHGSVAYPMPACTLSKITVQPVFSTLTTDTVLTIFKNAAPTGMTVTVPAGSLAQQVSAVAVAFASGDVLDLVADNTGGGAGNGLKLSAIAQILPP